MTKVNNKFEREQYKNLYSVNEQVGMPFLTHPLTHLDV
jgi:hypothetical protein